MKIKKIKIQNIKIEKKRKSNLKYIQNNNNNKNIDILNPYFKKNLLISHNFYIFNFLSYFSDFNVLKISF